MRIDASLTAAIFDFNFLHSISDVLKKTTCFLKACHSIKRHRKNVFFVFYTARRPFWENCFFLNSYMHRDKTIGGIQICNRVLRANKNKQLFPFGLYLGHEGFSLGSLSEWGVKHYFLLKCLLPNVGFHCKSQTLLYLKYSEAGSA